MNALYPISTTVRAPGKKQKTRKMPGVKTPKAPEVRYRRRLDVLTRALVDSVNTYVVPQLKSLEPEYVNDQYATELTNIFNDLRKRFADINEQAKIASDRFVMESNSANKQRFYKALDRVIGIDLASVIQNEDLQDILIATTRENVALIRSIPEEYFKQIETMVFTGTTQGSKAGPMIKQIQKIGRTTKNRAKVIARDQSSKLNSALNQQRQQNLGVEEYIWRTSKDERVRPTHKSKNGKVFRWDKPPKGTGHPGQDIQCRCVAQAIIKV